MWLISRPFTDIFLEGPRKTNKLSGSLCPDLDYNWIPLEYVKSITALVNFSVIGYR
jgi:hypothetical protein